MMIRVALATTHHDPDGRLYAQAARLLPHLCEQYGELWASVTAETQQATVDLLRKHAVRLHVPAPNTPSGMSVVGGGRRMVVARALTGDCDCIHLCDFDRILHWAEYHPQELAQVVAQLDRYDFTVLGRTQRAFATHPRVQQDTETIINQVFARVSGQPWDVTAAARGLTRRAAEAIVAHSQDDTVGNDCSWPLVVQREAGLTMGYLATEGLEFETMDRYGDQVAALGGREQWIARLDADPSAWAQRLDLARLEVEAMVREQRGEPGA